MQSQLIKKYNIVYIYVIVSSEVEQVIEAYSGNTAK